jgi:hypothetical protein
MVMGIRDWIQTVLVLRGGVKRAIRKDITHDILNATPIIYKVAKQAKREGRLTDQEYSLINVKLALIEGNMSCVHKMNIGREWLLKKST